MYAVFKSGMLVELTDDAEFAADQVSTGAADKLRKVTTLEELAEAVKLEQANACTLEDDHAGRQVVSVFNEFRAELERGAKRLMDQVRSCDRDDLKQQAKECLEKARRAGVTAMEELRRKIHAATADKPSQAETEPEPSSEPREPVASE
jgi:hypothetical protein